MDGLARDAPRTASCCACPGARWPSRLCWALLFPAVPVTAGGQTSPTATVATATGPVAAEISQFRDNYSKQIIEIQLTNTTGSCPDRRSARN